MSVLGVYTCLYDFNGEESEELSVAENDVVLLLSNDDDDWWKVKKSSDGATGLLPSNYLEEMDPIYRVKAIYAYEATDPDEITMEEGDELDLFINTDPDWFLVKKGQSFGMAPSSYLEEIPDEPEVDNTSPVAESVSLPKSTKSNVSDIDLPVTAKKPTVPVNLEYFSVQEIEKSSKKKKKGKLGVGGDSVYWACEVGKVPVQQYFIVDIKRCDTNGKHLLLDFMGKKPECYNFHCGKKTEAEKIKKKIKECWEICAKETTEDLTKSTPTIEKAIKVEPKPTTQKVVTVEVEEEEEENREYKQAIALYDFQAEAEDELSVAENQIVMVIDDSDPEWWICQTLSEFGEKNKGNVPASYFKLIEEDQVVASPPPPPRVETPERKPVPIIKKVEQPSVPIATPPVIKSKPPVEVKPDPKYAIALFDFDAESEDEVTLKEGDPVLVLDDFSSKEWWTIRVVEEDGTEKEGTVPGNYLEIADLETIQERQREIAKKKAMSKTLKKDVATIVTDSLKKNISIELKAKPTVSFRRSSDDVPLAEIASVKASDMPRPDRVKLWTDRTGSFQVEAEFLKVEDGKVHLHKTNGKRIAVPWEKMSLKDMELIEKVLNETKGVSSLRKRSEGVSSFDWVDFLLNAGIEAEKAIQYSKAFKEERLDERDIPNLTNVTLRRLGISGPEAEKILNLAHDPKTKISRPVAPMNSRSLSDEQMARRLQEEEDYKLAKMLEKHPEADPEQFVKSSRLPEKNIGVSFQRSYGASTNLVSDNVLNKVQERLTDPTYRPEDDGWEAVRTKLFSKAEEKPKAETEIEVKRETKNMFTDLEGLEVWANTATPSTSGSMALTTTTSRQPPPPIPSARKGVDIEKVLPPSLIPAPIPGFQSSVFVPTNRKPPPPPPTRSNMMIQQHPNVQRPAFQSLPPMVQPRNTSAIGTEMTLYRATVNARAPPPPPPQSRFAPQQQVNPFEVRRAPPPVPSLSGGVNPFRPFDAPVFQSAAPPPIPTRRNVFEPVVNSAASTGFVPLPPSNNISTSYTRVDSAALVPYSAAPARPHSAGGFYPTNSGFGGGFNGGGGFSGVGGGGVDKYNVFNQVNPYGPSAINPALNPSAMYSGNMTSSSSVSGILFTHQITQQQQQQTQQPWRRNDAWQQPPPY